MKVKLGVITEQFAMELIGQQMPNGVYFNPIQLLNESWCVSEVEIEYITEYELIEYEL